jgi:hypothetical protein
VVLMRTVHNLVQPGNQIRCCKPRQALAGAADQQRPFIDQTDLFELVVAERQICFQTAQHGLRQQTTAFMSRLVATDAKRSFGEIVGIDIKPPGGPE